MRWNTTVMCNNMVNYGIDQTTKNNELEILSLNVLINGLTTSFWWNSIPWCCWFKSNALVPESTCAGSKPNAKDDGFTEYYLSIV